MRLRASLVCLAAVVPALASAQPAGRFKHVIIVVQENRTPDNLFGSNARFEPGVDVATSGLNSKNEVVPLTAERLDSCYDVNHSVQAFRQMYNGGAMNGADLEPARGKTQGCTLPPNPQFKFVDNSTGTVQPYFDIAKTWGFANRMFQTEQGGSYPGHQFLFGGTSAPDATSPLFTVGALAQNSLGAGCIASAEQRAALIDQNGSTKTHKAVYPCFDRPTLADVLDAAGLTWHYYVDTLQHHITRTETSIWNAPTSITKLCQANGQGPGALCVGREYVADVDMHTSAVLTDIRHCRLPAVSWVVPSVPDSDHSGIGGDGGPSWVAAIVNSVGEQPACTQADVYWKDTAILITWDDWGGWYDHVPPFQVKGAGSGWGAGFIYGFRVPLLVVSAYTPAGYVNSANLDFGSLLRFVEENFGLGLIGAGTYADAYATDLTGFFSLSAARPFVHINAPLGVAYFLNRHVIGGALDDE